MTATTTDDRTLDRIIDDHFAAELRGDLDALVDGFAPDVEHDVVGNPSVSHGREEVRAFYAGLFSDLSLERITPVHRYRGAGFLVDESIVDATAIGMPFGIPGRGRALRFRLLHVFEVRDGAIVRENAWLDVPSIMAQLAN